MSAVENFASRVETTELNSVLIVVRSAVAVLLSPAKSIRLPPTVRRERCVSFLFCLILQTRLPYVTILPFCTKRRGMKAIVFVAVGIRVPTPFAKRPSSLANDICQIVLVGPWMRSLYSKEEPVTGSTTELMDRGGRDWMARMLATIEYLVAATGWVECARRMLTRAVWCWLSLVGYRWLVLMCAPSHPCCRRPV